LPRDVIILKLKCTKFDFGWGSLLRSSDHLRGLLWGKREEKGWEGRERRGGEERAGEWNGTEEEGSGKQVKKGEGKASVMAVGVCTPLLRTTLCLHHSYARRNLSTPLTWCKQLITRLCGSSQSFDFWKLVCDNHEFCVSRLFNSLLIECFLASDT